MKPIYSMQKPTKIKEAALFSVCFFILAYLLSSFHEMWRDEIQAWSLAFNSHSISGLFHITRFEGHGKLWYLMLYFLQLFTASILSMKIMHVFLAALYVFVFYFFSPFKTIEKILFCFGYYFIYEYAVISRDYSIEILLLFLCTGIYLKYKEHYLLLISMLLFFLFQTNIYGIIIGIVFYVYMIIGLIQAKTGTPKTLLPSILIVVSGLLIAVYFYIPPADQGFASGWFDHYDARLFNNVITKIFVGYFPFPEIKIEFWNSHFTDTFPSFQLIQIIATILVILCITLMFKDRIKILLSFYAATLGLLLFSYFKYYGYQRHHGQLLLVFILCLWIYYSDNKNEALSRQAKFVHLRKYFFLLILIVNFLAACFAAYYEIKYPFSNAEATTQYLKSESLDTMNIGGDEYPVSAISALLNKPFYFPQSQRSGIYIIYDNKWRWLSQGEIIDKASAYFEPLNKNCLLILSNPVDSLPPNWKFLKSFDKSIEGDENYFIYKINPLSSPDKKD